MASEKKAVNPTEPICLRCGDGYGAPSHNTLGYMYHEFVSTHSVPAPASSATKSPLTRQELNPLREAINGLQASTNSLRDSVQGGVKQRKCQWWHEGHTQCLAHATEKSSFCVEHQKDKYHQPIRAEAGVEVERQEFEAWHRDRWPMTCLDVGEYDAQYADLYAEQRWIGWQAARASK